MWCQNGEVDNFLQVFRNSNSIILYIILCGVNMVSLDNARVLSYEEGGKTFEIYVDPDLALEIKEGRKDFEYVYNDLLAVEEIYKDAKKGDKISDKIIEDTFHTDIKGAVRIILDKGRLDLTTEQRRRLMEARKKELIQYIVRNSINPVTKAPHTAQRVETAIEQARVDVDINKPFDKQVDKIIEKIKPILPMSFQTVYYKIFVPSAFAGRISGAINKYEIIDRKWDADGFNFRVRVPAGIRDHFLSTISGLTQGNVKIEIEDN